MTTTATLTIVNSPVANLKSVTNTLKHLEIPARIAYTHDDLKGAEKLFLPGVGAFGAGMAGLHESGMVEAIRDHAARGVPTLGVCLGMQLLFESSEELGEFAGLGILPGRILRFNPDLGVKIPHMGWNQLEVTSGNDSPILVGISSGAYAYFVHSYYASTPESGIITACCDYGMAFPAVVSKGNVFGAQFHPEKSQGVGQRLLKNFAAL